MYVRPFYIKLLCHVPFLYSLLTRDTPIKDPYILPYPCWVGDRNTGVNITKGIFDWGGCQARGTSDPWQVKSTSLSWFTYAHSFDWMYDVRASNLPNRHAIVVNWTEKWLKTYQKLQYPVWQSDIVARRLTAWLSHYTYFFANADKDLRNAIVVSLCKHLKHLQLTKGKDCPEQNRITVFRGLLIGILSLKQESREKRLEIQTIVSTLCKTLGEQLKGDGFNKDSHLPTQIQYVKDCITIRSAMYNAKYPIPTALNTIIDKMVPAIKLFRHSDGNLAHMAGWTGDAFFMNQILHRVGEKNPTPYSLKDSGFFHIVSNKTSIIFDASTRCNPALDNAGLLSFEMSYKKRRIFVNSGYGPSPDMPIWQECLNTCAHSTICVGKYNAIPLDSSESLPLVSSSLLEEKGWKLLQGKHNGYKNVCSCIVRRAIAMNSKGTKIHGQDTILHMEKAHKIYVRFHLHPDMNAIPLSNGNEVVLRQSNTGWSFKGHGGKIYLQESFYIENNGYRRKTQQIVLEAQAKETKYPVVLKWSTNLL